MQLCHRTPNFARYLFVYGIIEATYPKCVMDCRMEKNVETIRLSGLTPYAPMLERQHARRAAVARGDAPNTLFLLEHAPVITLGRRADAAHVLHSAAALRARGIELLETDRGGDVTYHGPGQLVAYPILRLHEWTPSVGWYLRALEDALIDVLAHFGLAGARVAGYTGVWVDGAKVAAIGIGVRDWVTFHGIALNVAPDFEHFGLIVPCGIADKPVTSLGRLLGEAPPLEEASSAFEAAFRARFGV